MPTVLITGAGRGTGHIDYIPWQDMLRVNVIATVRATEAFIGHLEASGQKGLRVTSVTSSIEHNDKGGRFPNRKGEAYVW